MVFLTYNIFEYTTSSKSEARELTKNVDVAICKYISVHVGGFALYHHQVTWSTTVVLAHWWYCQSFSIARKVEFGWRRVSCLQTHAYVCITVTNTTVHTAQNDRSCWNTVLCLISTTSWVTKIWGWVGLVTRR